MARFWAYSFVHDNEVELYYLQSRYYDPALGRFINADAFAATGQGLIGYNMFAYCNNSPINFCDPCGTCAHRLDFWNDCDECSKNKEKGITITWGKYYSVNLWILNITLSSDVAVDSKGNIQPTLSVTKDINASGKLSVSKGNTLGIYFVPDTSYLYKTNCNTYNVGGGLSIPVPPLPVAAGGAINVVANTDGDIGIVGSYGFSSISASGGEWHVGIIDTYPMLPQFNIPRAVQNLLERGASGW